MAIYRSIQTAFWQDAKVLEEMTPEDRYFYLYLLTNPAVKQVGIYQLTRKQMAFELGYSMESVNALLERFIHHHDIIRYDYDTREICIVNWGKYNFPRAGTPIENCIRKSREVKQTDFIKIIYDKVENKKIKAVFDEYFNECPSRIPSRDTSRVSSRGEKEKRKEKQKEKEQQHSVTGNKADEVRLLKSSFSEISDEDIETVLGVLEQKREGISYLREKIEVVQNTDNVKSIVGYLIKAILQDYRKFGVKKKNGFKNFEEPVNRYTPEQLNEKVRQSQERKFNGVGN